MELGITIPLQFYLKQKKPPYPVQKQLHFCWDLHLIKPLGTPSLLAVHASSRYAFVAYNPSLAQWQDLPELFLHGLLHAFQQEGVAT